MEKIVSTALEDSVVFVDTQSHENAEFTAVQSKGSGSRANAGEVDLALGICSLLLKVGNYATFIHFLLC